MEHTWVYGGTEPLKIKKMLSKLGMGHRMFNDIKRGAGVLLVDGRPVRPTTKILPHQPLTIKVKPDRPDPKLALSYGPVNLVYEDDNWLIVNKPAGMASLPGPTTGNDTLLNRIKGHLITEDSPELSPHLVTRLDYDTSGVLLVAKHRVATSMISSQVEAHQLHKTYFALVGGNLTPAHGVISQPIKRIAHQRARVIAPDGQPAETEYWVLAHGDGWTAIKAELHSGRTHQVRVHLASVGHPLLGDVLYGGDTNLISRQALHALHFAFADPFSGKTIAGDAPLPNDLRRIVGLNFTVKPD